MSATASASAHSLLTMETIQEQQRIIESLKEIITKLKGQVQTLEADKAQMQQSQRRAENVELTKLKAENASLRSRIQEISKKSASLQETTDMQAHVIGDLRAELEVQNRVTQELTNAEKNWQRERSVMHLVEGKSRDVELACHDLRLTVRDMAHQKRKWRSLASTIAMRLDPSIQDYVNGQIKKMIEEDERHEQARNTRSEQQQQQRGSRLHANATPLASDSCEYSMPSGASNGGGAAAEDSAVPPDPLTVLAVWNRRCATPLPQLQQNSSGGLLDRGAQDRRTLRNTIPGNNNNNNNNNNNSSNAGVRRSKGGARFLVPF